MRSLRSNLSASLAALGLLVVAGIVLRVVALFAWSPTTTSLADSWPYSAHAVAYLFDDPQHPPGYSLALRIAGVVTRDVAVYTIAQHLLAVAAAVTLFLAVRRLCGSPWPALVGAAVILLGADQVYLEHAVASEALFVPLLAAALYAVARAYERPERWWPWPPLAAALLVAAALTRTAALFLLPVVLLGLALAHPRPWLPRWRPLAAFATVSVAMLLAYAGTNDASHGRFEITTAAGWHLYGRVAPFAWCGDFTPPTGTARLCESSTPSQRPGSDWYLYDPGSPSARLFGYVGAGSEADAKLGAFARAAVLHQPKTYLKAVGTDVEAYFFPHSYRWSLGRGGDLDSQLDWSAPVDRPTEAITRRGMEEFFSRFTVTRSDGALRFLHDYQRTFRFGATLLTISTVLVFLGLLTGTRRRRVAVLVLGVGGLAMVVLPTFSIIYIARYTVPPAGVIAAGGAIGAMSAIDAARRRLSAAISRRRSPVPA
jgi:4-amino-4-deoxy-L-arabinose transferase-like glycosyltransferase